MSREQVEPVASLPFLVNDYVPRLLINREPVRGQHVFRYFTDGTFLFDHVSQCNVKAVR